MTEKEENPILTVALMIAVTIIGLGLTLVAATGSFNKEFDQQIGNWWVSATILGFSATLLLLSIRQMHRHVHSRVLAIVALTPLALPIALSNITGSPLAELSEHSASNSMIMTFLFWCAAICSICGLFYGLLQAVIEVVWLLRQSRRANR